MRKVAPFLWSMQWVRGEHLGTEHPSVLEVCVVLSWKRRLWRAGWSAQLGCRGSKWMLSFSKITASAEITFCFQHGCWVAPGTRDKASPGWPVQGHLRDASLAMPRCSTLILFGNRGRLLALCYAVALLPSPPRASTALFKEPAWIWMSPIAARILQGCGVSPEPYI